MKMPSVMTHNFTQVPQAQIPRSSFNRSHGHKTTFDAGILVPVYVDEALPGDTFNMNMAAFARMATPIVPIMDNLFMDIHFFAVPNRLVWSNWQKFNGEQDKPTDSTDYLVPTVTAPATFGWGADTIGGYMGIPIGIANLVTNALPFRAYNLIWNEWYRDENLQDSVTVNKGDGPDTWSTYSLKRRGKRKDYFTSALPWPQKGPAVSLPLGTSAPVITDGNPWKIKGTATGTTRNVTAGALSGANVMFYSGADLAGAAVYHAESGLKADLSSATAATINQLRQSFQIQKLYERDARGGTRYTEIIRSHFGVISPDARLQRPEYLGGGTINININPVAQTSSTDATTPQGHLAGIGTASGSGIGFVKSFTEHCYIIGLVSVRADLNYQQGLNKLWSRSTRFDFYWPALSHIGEQAILNKEIMAQGTSADNNVFGYQERYAEYRFKPSIVSGLFKSGVSGSLDYWHLAQNFSSLPALNATFIEENPPVDRVIAVPAEPHFIMDTHFSLKCARPMPVYSVPGLIDHF